MYIPVNNDQGFRSENTAENQHLAIRPLCSLVVTKSFVTTATLASTAPPISGEKYHKSYIHPGYGLPFADDAETSFAPSDGKCANLCFCRKKRTTK